MKKVEKKENSSNSDEKSIHSDIPDLESISEINS